MWAHYIYLSGLTCILCALYVKHTHVRCTWPWNHDKPISLYTSPLHEISRLLDSNGFRKFAFAVSVVLLLSNKFHSLWIAPRNSIWLQSCGVTYNTGYIRQQGAGGAARALFGYVKNMNIYEHWKMTKLLKKLMFIWLEFIGILRELT